MLPLSKKRLLLVLVYSLASDSNLYACSVQGYVGEKGVKSILIELVKRQDSRGYDSSGIAFLDHHSEFVVHKTLGAAEELAKLLDAEIKDGTIGIGHTRWATHGEVSTTNAHPLFSTVAKPPFDGDVIADGPEAAEVIERSGRVAIVHNGIISNYSEIKNQHKKLGYEYVSETDSEVIPHVLDLAMRESSDPQHPLKEALQSTVSQLKGQFAFIGMISDFPDTLVVATKDLPMTIGIGKDEKYVASAAVYADQTDQVIYLPNNTFAILTKSDCKIYSFNGEEQLIAPEKVTSTVRSYNKSNYPHYMKKEIFEQSEMMKRAITYLESLNSQVWDKLGISKTESLQDIQGVNFFGCGTSYNSACIGSIFFEEFCQIEAKAHLASEFKFRRFSPDRKSICMGISQSGETADTLEALRKVLTYVKSESALSSEGQDSFEEPKKNLYVSTLTNVPGSTMTRVTENHFLPLNAGPELSVASTKAFTAQIATLYYLANYLAYEQGKLTQVQFKTAVQNLKDASDIQKQVLEESVPLIEKLARTYSQSKAFMYLGRHVGHPFAVEGALKLAEISYISSHPFAAGEMKHGPLALLDEGMPVVIFSHQDPEIYKNLTSNAHVICSRKGRIIAFAFEGQTELIELARKSGGEVIVLPHVGPLLEPVVMSGIMQFLAYQLALELELNIDHPRHLAKSVTVE
jgi:glucosamine--fructose-6-phosphate aminotransferase (isomerizing)